jgi:deoxyadenosine/deoxycytidine kinase
LFSQATVCDYLFDKDKIFAYLNLDDNELFIYQRLYDLLAKDIPSPDLVIYLQAPTDILVRRLRERAKDPQHEHGFDPDPAYMRELNEAYQHFFFHYAATPLLVVETSQLGTDANDEAVDDLIKQIRTMNRGTRYYVPRT